MPTTVTKTIQASGGDYATIQLWDDGAPANLVTSDQVWKGLCANENFTASGADTWVWSGSTTDSTRYKWLTTNTGASFRDNANKLTNALRYNTANGASMAGPSGYFFALSFREAVGKITGMQIARTSGNWPPVDFNSLDGVLTLEDCIVQQTGSSTILSKTGSGGQLNANNCLFNQDSAATPMIDSGRGGTLLNCTIVRTSENSSTSKTALTVSATYTFTVKNCAIFNNATCGGGAGSYAGNNNATDQSSVGWGTSNQVSLTYANQFEQPDNSGGVMDFRAKSGGTILNNGADLSGSGITDDIVGTSRPQGSAYDIGCWELVASSTPSVLIKLVGPGGGLVGGSFMVAGSGLVACPTI